MTLLGDIGGYLDTQSALVTLGTNFFYSVLPESPDNCVALLEIGGVAPIFTLGSNNAPRIERPQLQLLVRNTSYETGASTAQDLYLILTQIANQSINGTTYLRVVAMSNPNLLERDLSKRCVFTCNFDVQYLP